MTGESLRAVIRNTGWQFADNGLRMAVGLLLGVWLARYLGPEPFGTYSFAVAFAALFSPLAAMGLDDIAVRNLVRAPETHQETLGTAFLLKLFGGGLALGTAAAAVVLLRPAGDVSRWLVIILAGGSVFQAFTAVDFWFHSRTQAKYSVLAKSGAFLAGSLVKAGLILAAAPLVAFAWAGTFEAAAVALGLVLVYRWRGHRVRDWRSTPTMARRLVRDSWPLFFSCIVIMVYLRIDQVMLGEMAGDAEVGVYSVAVRLAEVWYFIPTAIYWSVLPGLVKAKETDEARFYASLQKYYNLMALLAYGIAIPTTFFADDLVVFLFGVPYARAGTMLALLIWANLFIYLEIARSAFLNIMNWNRVYFVMLALGAALNVTLNWLWIPRYGGVGAVAASCVSYWFSAHGACFLWQPLRRTGWMLAKAMICPKVW